MVVFYAHLAFVGAEPHTKRVCERSKWPLVEHNRLLRSQTRFVRGSDNADFGSLIPEEPCSHGELF